MDLIRLYIIQSVQSAANNLRLSTEKIEVVALLKEYLISAKDLEKEILHLKKITEFSKFAIKLGEVYNYIAKDKVDFLKISDKFKEHSGLLVRELNFLLDVITPTIFNQKISTIKEQIEIEQKTEDSILFEQTELSFQEQELEKEKRIENESEKLKEEYIFQEVKSQDNRNVDNYELELLNPIKRLDSLLERIARQDINIEEINYYLELLKNNIKITEKLGFSVLTNMHKIFINALDLIRNKELLPIIPVIEGMRACLIVIVALVRGKDVDITLYLNRAENFGKQINSTRGL